MAQREVIKTIRLKKTATLGERTIEELNIARPKTRDFLRTDGHNIEGVGADVALLSSLTGEPEELICEIDYEDWAIIRIELQKIWLRYFGIEPQKSGAEKEDDSKKKNS